MKFGQVSFVLLVSMIAGCTSEKVVVAPPPIVVERVEPTPIQRAAIPKKAAEPPKTEPTDDEPTFADGPTRQIGKEESRLLVKALPLRLDAIRFEAIDRFLLLYAPFTSNKALLRAASRQLRDARAQLAEEASVFSLATDMKGLLSMVKPPQVPHYMAFVASADGLVARTRTVIADFYEKVRDDVGDGERELILGQIGRNPSDTSIADRNSRALERLRQQLTKGMQICDGDHKNCRSAFPD